MSFNFLLETYPTEPGVYLMKNGEGKVLYIGKAKNLRSRLSQYFKEGGDERKMIPLLRAQIQNIDIILTLSDKEALLLENSLIKEYKPKYNVLLKDDKTYLSLYINPSSFYPKLELVRYKESMKNKGLFFGPYTSGFSARQTYETLLKTFPLRQCSDKEFKSRKTPCILYSIKRCLAPCTGVCTKEEYDDQVKNITRFLKGTDQTLFKELEAKIHDYSKNLEFEKADILYRQIKALRQVSDHYRYTARLQMENTDIFATVCEEGYAICKMEVREHRLLNSTCFYIKETLQEEGEMLASFLLQHYEKHPLPKQIFLSTNLEEKRALSEILHVDFIAPLKGEKKRLIEMAEKNAQAFLHHRLAKDKELEELLLQLEEICALNRFPYHIECFDTSHMAMENPVASMVAFLNGKKSSKQSRLYHIKHSEKSEDYASMKEALFRRLSRGQKEDNLPDLIILDGGKGQLSIAKAILAELGIIHIDLIAFAKEKARHDKGLSQETIYTLTEQIHLPPRSPLQFFLQRIRDEAHKMAIEYHRKRKSKQSLTSELDKIPGIGETKKKALLKHFGSLEAIKKASKEALLEVKGLSDKDANLIIKNLNL